MASELPRHLWKPCPDCGQFMAPDDPCECDQPDPDMERDLQRECPSNALDIDSIVTDDVPF